MSFLPRLNEQFPCRQLQIQQLFHLLSPCAPSPPAIVVHGLEATCKTSLVQSILTLVDVAHAIVSCRECITGRHLLERIILACVAAVQAEPGGHNVPSTPTRCENLAALAVQLQKLLEGRLKFVLVLDGVDHQREPPSTLLPALARMNEFIPNLTIVFIVTFPRQGFLHTSGTPHIHFPSYSRDEAIEIISRNPLPIFTKLSSPPSADYSEELQEEDKEWLWTRFCGAVWDSLAKSTARDVISFRALAEKLWTPFVSAIVDGTYGTRDFSRLMVAKRALFQDEEMLVDKIVDKTGAALVTSAVKVDHDLSYYSKYLLCAAYLASYNPPRTDATFFMKSSEKKRRRKAGGTTTGRVAKHRKIPRRLLHPSPFGLERLLAIFHAIVPHRVLPTADIYTQIATLTSLRLLLRSGIGAGDVLDPAARWRVNIGWEYVVKLGRAVGFEVVEFSAE